MQACRRCVAALPLLALLAGCASVLGPRRVTLSEAQIAQRLAERFPVERRVMEVFDLRIGVPAVRLLPESNRVGIDLDLSLGQRYSERRFPMQLALEGAPRYDEAGGAVVLSQVRVQRLSVGGLPDALAPALRRIAEPLVERLLEDAPLHRFTPEQLKSAGGRGLRPGPIRVTSAGVEMTLEER